jgi:radical SAM superfamily enzyme YgiQ (UPF0313 family)
VTANPSDRSNDVRRQRSPAGSEELDRIDALAGRELPVGPPDLPDGQPAAERTKRPDEVAHADNALRAHDIFVHGNFVIGLPGEAPATVDQRLRGIEKIGFDSIGGGPILLTPGSTFERSGRRGGDLTLPRSVTAGLGKPLPQR